MDPPQRPPPSSPAPSSSPHTPKRGRGGRRSESSPRGRGGATPRGARGGASPTPARGTPRGGADAPRRGGGRDRPPRQPKPQITKEQLEEGLKSGRYYSGLLRVNPSTRKTEAYVIVPGFARDVLITGTAARGRAFDGDTVAVELLEYDKWQVISAPNASPTAAALVASDSEDDDNNVDSDNETTDPFSAAVSARLSAHSPSSVPLPVPGASPQATSSGSLSISPMIPAPASSPVSQPSAGSALRVSNGTDEDEEEECNESQEQEDEAHRRALNHFSPALAPPSPLPPGVIVNPPPVAAATASGSTLTAAPSTLLEGEIRRPTGRIVGIIEAGHQEMFAGTVRPCGRREKKDTKGGKKAAPQKSNEEQTGLVYTDRIAFFVPLERRCPKLLIRLPNMTPNSKLLASFNEPNNLFVAKLIGWQGNSSLPHAQLLSLLGNATLPTVQHEALSVTHDLPQDDFPPEAIAAVPPEASRDVQPSDLIGRRDLRSECVFTIDPTTARDLDDALHVKEVAPNRYEVGIHIADVSYYLRPGTPLDREARRRATSVYLVHKVIPMLPRLLCEHACSLNPGADRLAFSVIVTLDEEGRVQDEPWFGRTVIHSAAKLSYDSAQGLLDGHPAPTSPPLTAPSTRFNAEHLRTAVRRLHALSLPMRRRRFESGALQLGSSKLVFTLDAQGMPVGVGTYVLKETNRLIEEFMLLANVAVARRIHQAFPQGALLRRHASPPENKLQDLTTACSKIGASLIPTTAGTLNVSLEELRATNPALHMVVQHLCTKPMQTAKYIATDPSLPDQSYAHYALSFAQYTHFTSPIRRYADVAVHRLLQAALQNSGNPFKKEEMEALVANCNRRKMNADKASDDCDYLYLCRYLQAQPTSLVEEAIVLELNPAKSWVVMLLPRFDIEEMLFLKDLKATETWNAAQDQLSLAWEDAPTLTLRVLSRVSVRLLVNTEIKPLAIRLHLVRQPLPPAPAAALVAP